MDRPHNTPAPQTTVNSFSNEPQDNFLADGKANNGIKVAEVLRILRKRWLPAIIVATTVMTGVAIATLKEPRIYQSQTAILVDDSNSVSGQLGLTSNAPAPIFQPKPDLSTEIQILKSSTLIGNALKPLNDPKMKIPVGAVANRITIQQIKDAKVLVVTYRDTDAQRVQTILSTLGNAYVDYSLESRRSRATNAISFIEEQLPKAKENLEASSRALQEFRQHYGFVDPDAYANSVSTAKQELEKEAARANINLQQTNRQYQEILRQMAQAGLNPQNALTTSMLTEDSGYRDLVKKLQEIDLTYAQESLRFLSTHPKMQNLRIERDKIVRLLQERAEKVIKRSIPTNDLTNGVFSNSENSTAQSLTTELLKTQTNLAVEKTQIDSIRQSQAEVANLFQKIPPLQQYYAELQRQYKINSEQFNGFLQKLQELRIKKAEEIAPWKILEPAYLPTQPVSPKVEQRLLMGLMGGLGMGVLTALLLEWLDTRIKDPEEVKALTGIPVLGTIPAVDKKTASPVFFTNKKYQRYNFSPFTESLRSLALNLTYVSPQRGGKILALTSAIPQEGKSTTTYNLGVALTEMGHRVLIVDADMHRPIIHKLLDPTNAAALGEAEGLSTTIATARPWQELIHTPPGADNPHVIVAGPTPPNPVVLLNSQRMTDLMNEWCQEYDYVLIDTPPIVGLTDAQCLATKVDGMILVVAMNQTSRIVVKRAMEILRGTYCNMAGLIINKIDQEHQGYYYQYYSSYYTKKDNQERNGHRNPVL